jgi:hypothetical protein
VESISQSIMSFPEKRSMLRTEWWSLSLGSFRRKTAGFPLGSGLETDSGSLNDKRLAPFSTGLESWPLKGPMEPGRLCACDPGKTSAVILCCDEKGTGGEEAVVLNESRVYALLERLEGLVLLGLGPPAMSRRGFVLSLWEGTVDETKKLVVASLGRASEQLYQVPNRGWQASMLRDLDGMQQRTMTKTRSGG